MKNKISTIASATGIMLFALTLFSCDAQNNSPSKNSDLTHSAKTSLDYDGIYRSTIPCADCEGIKATVYLMRDQTFKTIYDYLGKEAEPVEITGKFTWNKEGNSITLQSGKDKSIYFVGENTLTQLDQDGKKMTGELASKYILTKDNYKILNRKWKLVELMGKPVDNSQTMDKDAYIQFNDNDNRYTAYAGCNTVSGSFATESYNRLKLGMGISTMMSCQNMTIESEMNKVLSTADSFQVDGNNLVLIKGRMAPLAKFVAPVN